MRQWIKRYQTELWLYAAYTILSVLLLHGPWTPQIFPEEAGYIGWANRILYGQGSGYYFLPGYSLLLLPLMAVTNDITVIYPFLIIENVLLNGLLIVGLYRLAVLWEIGGRQKILAVAAVCLYAPFVIYTQKAICEPLLNVCGVWLAVFSTRVFERGNKKDWLIFVFLALFMMASHSREFVLLGVLPLVFFLCSKKKKAAWKAVGVLLLAGVACVSWVMIDSGTTAIHFREQLAGLFSLEGLGRWGITLVTQSSYWILSTFGFAPAEIWYGVYLVREKEKGWQAALFALLFFAATALLSALFMSHHSKAVQLVYGRYNDGALAGVFLLGAAAYCKKRPPAWIWMLGGGAAAVTALLYQDRLRQLTGDIMNALGLFLSRLFCWEFDFIIIGTFCLVVAVCLWRLAKKQPNRGLLLLCAVYLFQLCYIAASYLAPAGEEAPAMLKVIDRLEQRDLVWYCQDGYIRDFYKYSVYRPELVLSEEESGLELSKTWREGGALLGADQGTFLWAISEEARLRYQDLLLPADGWVETPKSRITLTGVAQDHMTVQVENQGSPWLCLSSIGDVQKAVRLGVRMFDQQGILIEERRFDFSSNMYQGDQESFSISLPSQAVTVSFELVQEFQYWFSQRGDQGRLTVDRNGNKADTPETDDEFHVLYPSFLTYQTERQGLPYRNNIEHFYDNWTEAESSYCHLNIRCQGKQRLVLETEDSSLPLQIIINGTFLLPEPERQPGRYVFSLDGFEGRIETITFRCEAKNPFQQSGLPEWLSFLSLDSHIKPVQLAVHGIRKVFGVDVNHHDFGVRINRIVIE